MIALLAQRVLPLLLRLVDVRHGDGWVDNSVVNDAGVATAETMDGIEHNAFCVAPLTQTASEQDYTPLGGSSVVLGSSMVTLASRIVTEGVNWEGREAFPGDG